MLFRYRVLTANCGNDTIGTVAVRTIIEQFNNDEADFYILNCQEVSFSKTLRQLRAQAKDLSITCSGYMPTHTKLATQFHADTGIATFILHKKEITVLKESTSIVRRAPTRLAGGSGYNKGGVVSRFSISKAEEAIEIEAISAHLDSNSAEKRSIDWYNIHEARRFGTMESIEELSASYLSRPMITAVGIDANTRNKLSTPFEEAENPWSNPHAHPELAAMHQAPIGTADFSNESTYREYNRPQKRDIRVTTTPDKKRDGYAIGGALDHVFISGGTVNTDSNSIIVIDPNPANSERDHSIILSPLQNPQIPEAHPLRRIQNLIAEDLRQACPSLAQSLQTDIDYKTLHLIHNNLLSKDGLLQKMMRLHARKLALNTRLNSINMSKNLSVEISAILFPPKAWLERIKPDTLDTEIPLYKAEIERMNSLLNIIEQYPLNETLVSACMSLFTPHNRNTFVDAGLKGALDQEYAKQYSLIQVDRYQTNQHLEVHLKESCHNVIAEVEALYEARVRNPLSAYDLSLLVEVLKQCNEITKALKTSGASRKNTVLHSAVSKLKSLSHEVSGRASPGWKNLARSLMALSLSAALLGIILSAPTFGISLIIPIALAVAGVISALIGHTVSSISEEKGLAKAISNDMQILEKHIQSNEISSKK